MIKNLNGGIRCGSLPFSLCRYPSNTPNPHPIARSRPPLFSPLQHMPLYINTVYSLYKYRAKKKTGKNTAVFLLQLPVNPLYIIGFRLCFIFLFSLFSSCFLWQLSRGLWQLSRGGVRGCVCGIFHRYAWQLSWVALRLLSMPK